MREINKRLIHVKKYRDHIVVRAWGLGQYW